MAPTRSRLVRREPLLDRLKAHLNPWDFLLWLSEELNSSDFEDALRQWATPLGLILNVLFMIARANSGKSNRAADDVFADPDSLGSGWLTWLAGFTTHTLALFSVANALYTFLRKRHYRLFESSVDVAPNTPNARRVRVDSSPLQSSPIRYILKNVFTTETAASRAHPDATRDVWELAVWDPTPHCLHLFCLFSPGHVLVYWLFLPLRPLDPRPSVTVVTTFVLAALMSAQLLFLHLNYTQQSKDHSLIHKEVQNEYDTKFVYPQIRKPVRDVAIQTPTDDTSAGPEVLMYTPTTYVNRGFHTNPNTNYSGLYDPDGLLPKPQPSIAKGMPPRSVTTPSVLSPFPRADSTPFQSSPLRPQSTNPAAMPRQQQQSRSTAVDGGSFGIYSHAQSPLNRPGSSGGAALKPRPSSPLKRANTPLSTRESAMDGDRSERRLMAGDRARRRY